MINTFTFTGRIVKRESRTTTTGKTCWTLLVHAKAVGDKGRPATIKVKVWRDNVAPEQTPVVVSGMFGSWEGKDGEPVMELTALDIQTLSTSNVYTKPQDGERQQPAPRPQPPHAVPYSVPESDVPPPGYPPAKAGQTANDDIPF